MKNKKKFGWLTQAPVVIDKFKAAVEKLGYFMQEQGLAQEPQEVYNVRGDVKNYFYSEFQGSKIIRTIYRFRATTEEFINQNFAPRHFFRIQKHKNRCLFRNRQTIQNAKKQMATKHRQNSATGFEFVLFCFCNSDYDYIMNLIANSTKNTRQAEK